MKSSRDVSTTEDLSFSCDATGRVTAQSRPERVAVVTQHEAGDLASRTGPAN